MVAEKKKIIDAEMQRRAKKADEIKQTRFNKRKPEKVRSRTEIEVQEGEREERDREIQMAAGEDRNRLGERIYSIANEKYPYAARKITGMLLEMPKRELEHLLRSRPHLEQQLAEAARVWEEHSSIQQMQQDLRGGPAGQLFQPPSEEAVKRDKERKAREEVIGIDEEDEKMEEEPEEAEMVERFARNEEKFEDEMRAFTLNEPSKKRLEEKRLKEDEVKEWVARKKSEFAEETAGWSANLTTQILDAPQLTMDARKRAKLVTVMAERMEEHKREADVTRQLALYMA